MRAVATFAFLAVASLSSRAVGAPAVGTSWGRVAPPSGPSPYASLSLAWDSARGLVVAYGSDGVLFDETWEWDGGRWLDPAAPALPPRFVHADLAYDSARGVAVLYGDWWLDETWEWDGSTWSQRFPRVTPGPRGNYAMAYDQARAVVVLFGGNAFAGGPEAVPLGDTWEWDGNEWSLRTTPIAPSARQGMDMAYDSDRGVTVLFGGTPCAPWDDCGSETWEWDGTDWTERLPSVHPPPRASPGLAYDESRGVTVLYGGYWWIDPVVTILNDTWEWDGVEWSQRESSSPSPIAFWGDRSSLVYDGTGVLRFGRTEASRSDTWRWNGSAWTDVTPAPVPPRRTRTAAAYDEVRRVTTLFGGADSIYGVGFDDTWEWDGCAWTRRTPPESPPPRYAHGLSYDVARGVTVLFGGRDSDGGAGPWPIFSDTWEWDGTTWTDVAPAASPPARYGAAFAYDEARGVSVLFGGIDSSFFYGLDDTWEWDGIEWMERSPAVHPDARFGAQMAYVAEQGAVLLFGGQPPGCSVNIGTALYGDTWVWDGASWSELLPGTIGTGRAHGVLTDDRTRGVAVLFGGGSDECWYPGVLPPATWEWNGAAWRSVALGADPGARRGAAMAFDPARGETVLFGGDDGWTALGDTWVFPARSESSLPAICKCAGDSCASPDDDGGPPADGATATNDAGVEAWVVRGGGCGCAVVARPRNPVAQPAGALLLCMALVMLLRPCQRYTRGVSHERAELVTDPADESVRRSATDDHDLVLALERRRWSPDERLRHLVDLWRFAREARGARRVDR